MFKIFDSLQLATICKLWATWMLVRWFSSTIILASDTVTEKKASLLSNQATLAPCRVACTLLQSAVIEKKLVYLYFLEGLFHFFQSEGLVSIAKAFKRLYALVVTQEWELSLCCGT